MSRLQLASSPYLSRPTGTYLVTLTVDRFGYPIGLKKTGVYQIEPQTYTRRKAKDPTTAVEYLASGGDAEVFRTTIWIAGRVREVALKRFKTRNEPQEVCC